MCTNFPLGLVGQIAEHLSHCFVCEIIFLGLGKASGTLNLEQACGDVSSQKIGTQGDTKLEKALKGINNISPDSGWLEGVLQEAGLGLFYVKLRCGILGQKFFGLDIAWTGTKVQVH